jgi:hypothetical protein
VRIPTRRPRSARSCARPSTSGARGVPIRLVSRSLVERLLGAVPALEPLARENGHGDPEGLLVHVFLGDVARRQAENVEAGRLAEPRAVLDVLEDEFGAGTPVDEPIAVSFVENPSSVPSWPSSATPDEAQRGIACSASASISPHTRTRERPPSG